MEEFFASLTRRQQMLLLTGVTFGGQDASAAFEHLMPEEAEVLRHRAGKLLEIPRDKRIPVLVQEIKRLVTSRKTYLWNAEPGAFARLLQREKPALREIILRALPVALAEAVREHLPAAYARQPERELKPGVLAVVRWKLEELLEEASQGAMWKFSDVLLLKPRELYTLVERQGVRALGIAFAALPLEERDKAFAALPPDVRANALKASEAASKRALSLPDAQALLEQHGFQKDPMEAIRSAGIQRLARSCMAQSPDFAQRLLERHRPPLTTFLQKWMADERTRNAARGDGGRAEIVAELERLEARALVDKPTRLPALKPKLPPPPGADRERLERRDSLSDNKGDKARPPGGHSTSLPSVVIAPRAPVLEAPPQGPRRDPIAEREARRAGAAAPAPKEQSGFRDPIAERNARRAGVSVRSPFAEQDEGRGKALAEAAPLASARMYRPAGLDLPRGPRRPPDPERRPPEPPRSVVPLPEGARNHPRGVGRTSDEADPTDRSRAAGPPSPEISQPIPDPSGSRLHRVRPPTGVGMKALKETRIMRGDSKSLKKPADPPERAPKVVGSNTGPRLAVRLPGERPKEPGPRGPHGKGRGRGPGGKSG